jgi:phage/plasmid-like protein (TIGR03299 family)
MTITTDNLIAARTPAWQRLGAEFPDLLTVDQALDGAGLKGWNVRGVPAGALLDPSDPLSWTEVPDKVHPVRDLPDGGVAMLGRDTVTTGYQFWQNEQLGEFAQQIAGVFGDEQIVSTAGSFEDGTKTFLCLSLEGFTVLGDDAHDQFLTVATGHNGSLSLCGMTGAVRVICRNTFQASLGQANKVTVKHQGDMIAKAGEAATVLAVARDWAKEYQGLAERLASQKISDRQFETIVRKGFVPEPAKDATPRVRNRADRDFETIVANFRTSPTTETGRGTRWAALNAITEWAEWGRPGDLTTEKSAVANLFGTVEVIRAKAVKVLVG